MQCEREKPQRRRSQESRGESSAQQCRAGGECSIPRLRPTVICSQIHESKPTVPLRVWVLASASCFAVCAALVVATVAITKWRSVDVYSEQYRSMDSVYTTSAPSVQPETPKEESVEDAEIHDSILEKISMFKNFINREKKVNKKDTLIHKPQYHPEFDSSITHSERKIEKKHQAVNASEGNFNIDLNKEIPDFKPTLPDVFVEHSIKLPDGYVAGLSKYDNDYYSNDLFYPDDPIYDDYVQSNSMTNYLIEKVQELYQWIKTDPELEGVKNSTETLFRKRGENSSNNELGQLLQALNESIVEGNVSIVMLKLKDLYLGGQNSSLNASQRVFLKNSSDLLSFGMLTLDVMLLHNIQIMAWETNEALGLKMLQNPDVFAFNALFMDPTKVESKRQEVQGFRESPNTYTKRRQEQSEERMERGLVESMLEVGLSAARAALHLGRAYKNAKSTLKQLSNRESAVQTQLARNSDSNAHALKHLRTSYNQDGGDASDQHGGHREQRGGRTEQHNGQRRQRGERAEQRGEHTEQHGGHTELDCIWSLYCSNLVASGDMPTPFGTMARINGIALRLITGDLTAEKAIDTLITEAFTGWSELKCSRMLPKCSHGEAATVVLDNILQHRKHSDHHQKP